MPISSKSLAILKATGAVVGENATKITATFYPNHLFKNAPAALAYFNPVNQRLGKQSAALGGAVAAFANNIDNLDVLGPALKNIATKHCALNVVPELYPIVRDNLLLATAEVLGDAVTPDVAAAWGEAIDELARILIEIENDMYEEACKRRGGFKGEKDFLVIKRTEIAHGAMEFRFQPIDNTGEAIEEIFEYMPGQYLTIRVPGVKAPRHYTVTSQPNRDNFLSCCIKELASPSSTDDIPPGEMSSHVHASLKEGDIVKLATPYGNFVPHSGQDPAILLSAGIGITPMSSFVRFFEDKGVNVTSVHIDKSPEHHAYIDRFKNVNEKHWWYTKEQSRPSMSSIISDISAKHESNNPFYYICGPSVFMKETIQFLGENNVAGDRVRWEAFGPALA